MRMDIIIGLNVSEKLECAYIHSNLQLVGNKYILKDTRKITKGVNSACIWKMEDTCKILGRKL